MKLELNSKIRDLPGVGPKIEPKLNKLGIETIQDLFFYWPRTYKDFTTITLIKDLPNDYYSLSKNKFTLRGRILGISNKKTSRRRFTVTEAVIEDGTGSIKIVWFNQPFLAKMYKPGSYLLVNGGITFNKFSQDLVMESPDRANYPKIEPIYRETEGITSKYILKLNTGCKHLVGEVKEWLPKDVVKQYELLNIQEAIENLHFPKDLETLNKAQRRVAFDELFMISLKSNLSKVELAKKSSTPIKVEKKEILEFINSLPYELTEDQKKAAREIEADLSRELPMNRLLNGDVGSGKTIVAAVSAYAVAKAGYRVVLMAPTSILAAQHYETFCKLFKNFDLSIGLFTRERKECSSKDKVQEITALAGSRSECGTITKEISNSKISNKKLIIDNCALSADIVIGTQALIQEGVDLKNLGLVIVDEQHRFGVKQRSALLELGTVNMELSAPKKPHFLSMTATPIPRTLHLALFGELDLSIISEKPKNRKEIKTRFVESENRDKAYDFVRAHLKAGRQAFIICPLIESKEEGGESREDNAPNLFEDEQKTVKREYEKLKQIFPEFGINMLHGRMKAKEKEQVMEAFFSGNTKLLVSTSVVEVGVDVPNATIMMIEDAEHFGLAQLHQFRGRVGRGECQSFCFLFSSTSNDKAIKRLRALESTSNGFKLAEIDLESRGPGAVFGTDQSGILDLKMASFSDRMLMNEASEAAKKIVLGDPELEGYQALKDKVSDFLMNKHL